MEEKEALEQVQAEIAAEEDAAIARGDVIEAAEPEPAKLPPEDDPAILAAIAEEEQTPEPEEEEKGKLIPKARFDEVNTELKELRAIVEELRKPKEEPEAADPNAAINTELTEIESKIKELRRQERAATIDGEDDQAEAAAEEIEKLRDRKAELKAELKASEVVGRSKEEESFRQVKATLEETAVAIYEEYPFLNINAAEKNLTAIASVVAERDRLMAQEKMNPVDALKAASKTIGEIFGKALGTPAKGETEEQKTARAAREKAAKESAVKALESQPASLAQTGKGVTSDPSLNLDNMSEKQYAALPETTKAKLRGDLV